MAEISLRPYQETGVAGVRDAFARKILQVLFVLPTGGGKCLGAGTPVLMFDGTIKAVEDVQVGDLLMGPDSKPRRVLSLARGREHLYRVTPTKGDPYVVNESHILSLKRTSTHKNPKFPCQARGGEIVNIGVRDYLASSATFKHIHKGWRAAVDFQPSGELLIEPYILGLWLGDGTSCRPEITTCDEEIADAWVQYGKSIGMDFVFIDNSERSVMLKLVDPIRNSTGRGGTPIGNAFRHYDLYDNKHIPRAYLTASREERLQLLAGIIDTDGHYNGKGFDLTLKSERLMDDVIFLARSLGFSAYKANSRKTCTTNGATGDYFRCSISGHVDQVPCRLERKRAAPRSQVKDVLVTGIKVEPIGEGDYYGFEIDGDHLFMLGDFTVTHNTYTFCYIASNAAGRGNNVIIIVHRKELLLQASKSLRALGIDHGMISPHFTPAPHKKVQVASIDTLMIRLKKNPDLYKFKLVIFDEAHHVTKTNKWGTVYELLGKPAMLGVTATPKRGDGIGLGEGHGGLFREMVIGPTVAELINMGMLINPVVYTSLEQPDLSGLSTNKDGDYNMQQVAERVDRPVITGSALAHYKKICPGSRAIVFCASIKHAKHVVEEFNAAGFRFALLVGEPEMSDAERTSVNRMLAAGDLDGAATVDLVSEGYDLPDLECCIMLRPTQSESLFLQQVGRVMRPSPGKRAAYLLDHVGNVGRQMEGEFKRKHGLPSDHRDWTLEGRKKKKKGVVEKLEEAKQCPMCWHVFQPAPCCPNCGHDMGPAARKLEQVEGELVQVTAEMEAKIKREQRTAQAGAKTVEDLMATMGYSRGRAEAIVKAREEKAALRDTLIQDLADWRQATGETSMSLFHVATADIRSMKPAALKDLRERFDKHRTWYAEQQQSIDFNDQRQRRNAA